MHTHVLEVILHECRTREGVLRILDVGCGDGRLLSRIYRELTDQGLTVMPFGLDVDDKMVQEPDFVASARRRLAREVPEVDWSLSLRLVGSAEKWPFSDGAFDIVVSNQVGEHVANLDHLLRESARVLREDGVGAHVFPLRQYTIEGHTGVPFAHRILSGDVREAYMRAFARLGASRLGPLRKGGDETPEYFAATRSDYVSRQTTYRSWKEIAGLAAAVGFTPSYRYTAGPYLVKLFGRGASVTRRYYARPRPVVDLVLFRVLSRVSSVTIFLRRRDRFDPELNRGHT